MKFLDDQIGGATRSNKKIRSKKRGMKRKAIRKEVRKMKQAPKPDIILDENFNIDFEHWFIRQVEKKLVK